MARADERSVLLGLLPLLEQVGVVAWAGARAAAKGAQLHRDGATGRVGVTDDAGAFVHVKDGLEQPERVVFRAERARLAVSCTCETAPCAHAAAGLHELLRRARRWREGAQQQASALDVLRERMRGVRAAEPAVPRVLSDLDRLPLDAAVDMLALQARQVLRLGPPEVETLTAVAQRVRSGAAALPGPHARLAVRLLQAMAVRKLVYMPLPEAAETAARDLAAVACLDGTAATAAAVELVDLVVEGHPQVGVHVAAELDAAVRRDAAVRAAVASEAVTRLEPLASAWRPAAALTARDRLVSALVAAHAEAGELEAAQTLARVWPPTRSGLAALAAACGAVGDAAAVAELAERHPPGTEAWRTALAAGAEAAEGAHHFAAARTLAARLVEIEPTPDAFARAARLFRDEAQWPARRDGWVADWLGRDEAAWLVPALAGESDAVAALLHAAVAGALRPRTVCAAVELLIDLDPYTAWRAQCVRLRALEASTAVSLRTAREDVATLQRAAHALGEPGLATDFVRLVAREAPYSSSFSRNGSFISDDK
ncbi:MAG: hypothetical protein EXR79_04280 [Myxococcales bacterium]|nr:hypothetical protein [Myxococcales bacterium]